jgi:hypothetical protein
MKSLFKKYTHYLVICSLLLTFACGSGNNNTQSDNVLNDTVPKESPQGITTDKTEAEIAAENAETDSLYNTYYTALMQDDYDKVMKMLHPVAFKITPKSEFLEDIKGMQTYFGKLTSYKRIDGRFYRDSDGDAGRGSYYDIKFENQYGDSTIYEVLHLVKEAGVTKFSIMGYTYSTDKNDKLIAFEDLPSSSPTTNLVVTIFDDCSYGGKSAQIAVGSYDLAQVNQWIGNDAMSSLKIPKGLTVTLYEHANYGGKSVVLTSDVPCLVDKQFNDAATSMKVTLSN